ncbi:MAG TPA: glycosyltransferase [Steroidobacteraceae bacterium]|jgi:alpha-1,6-mannosyltransferase|nr:glycosyltransferase [Steroidobacteraceae bacterium]
MHVVDATLFYSPTSGGVKRYLLAKHEWMRAHTNWRHSLVVPGERSVHAPDDVSMIAGRPVPGAFNYRLPLNPRRWSRAIEALEPDLIEVGDAFHPAWAAACVAHRRGIPLIGFYHSNFPELAGRRLGRAVQRFIEWYVRLTYEQCEQVLAPSRYTCEYLHSIGVMHTTQQPLGVDVDTFSPARRGRDLRAELGLPCQSRVLVFAGRYSAEKNIPVLVEAFRLLGEPWHLVLIGGGVAGREGNVTRLPYCRDNHALASYLCSADAFVHAGVHETFGLVILEAMACGRPVVAMRAGAIPELVEERAGCLAEPHPDASNAARSLAEAIRALYDRDLDALGASARRHVTANYSWTRALQTLMSRYQAAVSTRRLPAVDDALTRAEPLH